MYDFFFQIFRTLRPIELFFSSPWPEEANQPHIPSRNSMGKLSSHLKSISQSNIAVTPIPKLAPMVRSCSQDINVCPAEPAVPKSSLSDTCIDTNKILKPVPIRPMTIREQPSMSLEDDVCSTDSSVLDESEGKKKKRKLFNFSKKGKNKAD